MHNGKIITHHLWFVLEKFYPAPLMIGDAFLFYGDVNTYRKKNNNKRRFETDYCLRNIEVIAKISNDYLLNPILNL